MVVASIGIDDLVPSRLILEGEGRSKEYDPPSTLHIGCMRKEEVKTSVGCVGESSFTPEPDPLTQKTVVEKDLFSFLRVLPEFIY